MSARWEIPPPHHLSFPRSVLLPRTSSNVPLPIRGVALTSLPYFARSIPFGALAFTYLLSSRCLPFGPTPVESRSKLAAVAPLHTPFTWTTHCGTHRGRMAIKSLSEPPYPFPSRADTLPTVSPFFPLLLITVLPLVVSGHLPGDPPSPPYTMTHTSVSFSLSGILWDFHCSF